MEAAHTSRKTARFLSEKQLLTPKTHQSFRTSKCCEEELCLCVVLAVELPWVAQHRYQHSSAWGSQHTLPGPCPCPGQLPAQQALCKSQLGQDRLPLQPQPAGQPHSTGSFSHWPAALSKGTWVGSANPVWI